ncbi:hypothetical protein ACFV4N_01920 [Actinosynnema sp. NPDC059797]
MAAAVVVVVAAVVELEPDAEDPLPPPQAAVTKAADSTPATAARRFRALFTIAPNRVKLEAATYYAPTPRLHDTCYSPRASTEVSTKASTEPADTARRTGTHEQALM